MINWMFWEKRMSTVFWLMLKEKACKVGSKHLWFYRQSIAAGKWWWLPPIYLIKHKQSDTQVSCGHMYFLQYISSLPQIKAHFKSNLPCNQNKLKSGSCLMFLLNVSKCKYGGLFWRSFFILFFLASLSYN